MRNKPTVGQQVFILNVGNAARHKPQVLTPATVTKVGRKYFTALENHFAGSPHMATQYHLDTWREKSEYSANSKVYESPQEWADEREAAAIGCMLNDRFGSLPRTKLSLKSLRAIKAIIDAELANNQTQR